MSRETLSDEDLAMALDLQEQQRRLGCRVMPIEEICGLSPARRTTTPGIHTGIQPSYTAPRASRRGQIVPFIENAREAGALGSVMESNFTTATAAMKALRELAQAEGMTPGQVGICTQALLDLASSLPVESTKAALTATDLATIIGTGKTQVGDALSLLERAGILKRVTARRPHEIHLNPRYIYRGRAARFSEVLASYEALGAAGDGAGA